MSIRRNIRLLSAFNFFLDFAPYNPIAVIYFSTVTGSYAAGLSILSIGSIAACVSEVPTGFLSDVLGRKKTMLLGSIASTAAIASYAIGGTFWMLALGRSIRITWEERHPCSKSALPYRRSSVVCLRSVRYNLLSGHRFSRKRCASCSRSSL